MPVRLFRRFFSILLLVAYVSATILTVVPTAMAAPGKMAGGMAGMTVQADGSGDKMPMPCKMKSDCVTEIGCIFMVSLPAPDLAVTTPVVWSAVSYSVSSEFLDGRSTKPLLGPPISRA